MKYKVLALDIDGTLVNSQRNITPATKAAILELQQKGTRVLLASGRPTGGMLRYAKELEFETYGGYLLSFNGARITNCRTGELMRNRAVPPHVIPKLYSIALENGLGIVAYREGDEIVAGTEPNEHMMMEANLTGLPIYYVENFPAYVDFPSNKLLMAGNPDILERLEKSLGEEFENELLVTRSEPFFLEFMPVGIDKASALTDFMHSLGMTTRELVCCGDGYNDRSMIEEAGLGVAMANANEAVKSVADYVTASNDQDGVAKVIREFLL